MSGGPVSILVVGDDQAHRVLAQRLVDAVLVKSAQRGWPEAEQLDQARRWYGPMDAPELAGWADGHYRAKNARDDLRRVRMPSGRSPFLSRRAHGQAAVGDRSFDDIVQLAALLKVPPDALVMIRDTDGKGERAIVSEALRDLNAERLMVLVLGMADPEAEAWVLVALTQPDPGRGEVLRTRLGFDPTRSPERCTSSRDVPPGKAPRDAKRVLRYLAGEAEDLDTAPPDPLSPDVLEGLLSGLSGGLDRLKSAGEGCGLAQFVFGLEQKLAPRVIGSPRRA